MASVVKCLVVALLSLTSANALSKDLRIGSGGRTIQHFKNEIAAEANELQKRDPARLLKALYPTQWLDIPIDHFPDDPKYAPHMSGTFRNRYWFDASHYQPGGPVIILQDGETNGVGRLPYLQKGILAQLAQATNGIGVVLEHRYYGHSFPTDDLSTENLRFLTHDQAMADEVYFAQNVVFPGLEDVDLTSNSTAYISYGGSYAGAFSAFLRVKYPDVFWGSISSSGVTKAIYDYWAYYQPVTSHGPPLCISTQQRLTHVIDNILIGKNDPELTQQLKSAFGLPNVTADADFGNQLASGMGYWQSLNWDPKVSDDTFYQYCDTISNLEVQYPHTEPKRGAVEHLISEGGYTPSTSLVNQMLNYIGWINDNVVSTCSSADQDSCFSNLNETYYQQDDLSQNVWRSWSYQYCSEWGYLQTGSGVPEDQLPVISRTIDLDYLSAVCRFGFNITSPPDLEAVNKYGGYHISYPRLAFVDGEWDPWRPVTPHGFAYGAPQRESTIEEPFILIPKALHHYDENGRFPNQTTPLLPPQHVSNVQLLEQLFVKAWMDEYHAQ